MLDDACNNYSFEIQGGFGIRVCSVFELHAVQHMAHETSVGVLREGSGFQGLGLCSCLYACIHTAFRSSSPCIKLPSRTR